MCGGLTEGRYHRWRRIVVVLLLGLTMHSSAQEIDSLAVDTMMMAQTAGNIPVDTMIIEETVVDSIPVDTMMMSEQTAGSLTVDTMTIEPTADSIPVDTLMMSEQAADSIPGDKLMMSEQAAGSIPVDTLELVPTAVKKRSFLARVVMPIANFFMGVDTAYICESEYNFQALEQCKYNYETYRLTSPDGMSIGFSPRKSLNVGPYIGWSIIFVGLSVDVFHMGDQSNRQEYDISLYTLPFVIDIFYRSGGSVCKIDNLNLGKGVDTSKARRMRYDGFDADIYGFDITYIFNHRKFSYPAAYNQGSPQRRSSGSFLAGIGFTQHRLSADWDMLRDDLTNALGPSFDIGLVDSLRFNKITYSDLSISGGYAYNFVFGRHWLVGLSLSIGLSYKRASSEDNTYLNDLGETFRGLRDFRFSDLSLDFLGRAGIVYNTGRWFVGASAIINSFNYSSATFRVSSNFGTVNVYGGINFGKKKHAR